MNNSITYNSLFPHQSQNIPVFSFVANVRHIQQFARIDRASRNSNGALRGFQRPQIAKHIQEIKDYLSKDDALLPNSLVVAFISGVAIEKNGNGTGQVTIDISDGPKGWIVDGQQRFTALTELVDKEFEVFVSAFLCSSEEELHKQFILINNTRPLPKSLIYELLPRVNNLPDRYSSRSTAALLVEMLNFHEDSSLRGKIKQQTNPTGVIVDTAIQKMIMNSLSDGSLRLIYNEANFQENAFNLLNCFFNAVINTFPHEWNNQTPKSSRLVHGAGIIAMGYLMEAMFTLKGACSTEAFSAEMGIIKNKTAWTDGHWHFSDDDVRKWNSIQNVPRDIRQLSQYLVSEYKKEVRIQSR